MWDFGDTLADERWMRRALAGYPDWPTAWVDVMERYRDDWHVGRASERVIFNALSARTGLDVSVIDRHAVECCRSIRFHPFTWRIATERRLPQALVTVNPDLFVERVAPFYELERHFDAVVVSCVEATHDKVKLCEVALDKVAQFELDVDA